MTGPRSVPIKSKLRVFHLIKSLGRGGAEMLLVDGPRLSDPDSFEYGFGYFLPWKDAVVPDIAKHFGEVKCFRATNAAAILGRTPEVTRYLKAWRADLLHCHLPLASIVGRFAGAAAGVPVITTEHNLQERYHPVTRVASHATWRMQRQIIAVSDEVASSIARHAGTRVPIRVVRNGVTLDRFRREEQDGRAARRELGFPGDSEVVGTVSVFRTQKRLDLWLEVAKRLHDARPQTRFVIVGDGPLRSEVEDGIGRLGLSDSVVLTGLRDDVRPLLAAMDVYLMSSDFEGLPVALLEAMAMEVPPVATAVGGIPEVLGPASGGLVAPKGDVESLAAHVTAVLGLTAEERRTRGAAARARVAERFSSDRMMREIETIYREVASHG
jgi:L-malate glycosyltransferase